MTETQRDYLVQEFWILAWNGSVQRAKLYLEKTDEKKRLEFRARAIEVMNGMVFSQYEAVVEADVHCQNIQRITDAVTPLGTEVLTGDGYKIGVAQKAFNLILKYYWCVGLIAEPPHCPIDRNILNRTQLRDRLNWTQITTLDQYRFAIEHIRNEADKAHLSIAQWELETFSANRI